MAGFKAEGIVEALDFTLKPYVDAEGTIKEPSQAQVRAYVMAARDEARLISEATSEPAPELRADIAAMWRDMSFRVESLSAEAGKRQAAFISALCSGSPTAAQLQKLPHRVMIAFAAWISGEVLDPEAAAGAGNGQVLSLPSAAAG